MKYNYKYKTMCNHCYRTDKMCCKTTHPRCESYIYICESCLHRITPDGLEFENNPESLYEGDSFGKLITPHKILLQFDEHGISNSKYMTQGYSYKIIAVDKKIFLFRYYTDVGDGTQMTSYEHINDGEPERKKETEERI